jgi:hypothetical protein
MKMNVWLIPYAQFDLKKATVKIKDGTVGTGLTQNVLTVKIGEGTLTYSEKRNIQYTLDRGALDEVREGDQVPVDVKLDFTWTYLRGGLNSGDPATVEEALKNIGNAAAWLSSDSDGCKPYAVDIEITFAPTPSTCGDQEVILLPDFRWESMDHDAKAGTVSVSGKCNVTQATVTRTAQGTGS